MLLRFIRLESRHTPYAVDVPWAGSRFHAYKSPTLSRTGLALSGLNPTYSSLQPWLCVSVLFVSVWV